MAGVSSSAVRAKLVHGGGQAGVHEQIKALIYGNCIGDALGLLTEFMNKKEAKHYYGKKEHFLEFDDKVSDRHRNRWEVGDWTDDSDQMILIMKNVIDNHGQVDAVNYAQRLLKWSHEGFPELNDAGGLGIGMTTWNVLNHSDYTTLPHQAAHKVWEMMGCNAAPNGALMRTSVLGALNYQDLAKVSHNTLAICKVTHADPRCQLSCVAMTTALALMLQRKHLKDGLYDVEKILQHSFQHALGTVSRENDCAKQAELKTELGKYMFDYSSGRDLSPLKLDEDAKIGYTYKCLGAGCWALRQDSFEEAMQAIVMEAGDADTNGAVAGALLGCKLGLSALKVQRPSSGDWLSGLKHKDWLDTIIDKFLLHIDSSRQSDESKLPQRPDEGETRTDTRESSHDSTPSRENTNSEERENQEERRSHGEHNRHTDKRDETRTSHKGSDLSENRSSPKGESGKL